MTPILPLHRSRRLVVALVLVLATLLVGAGASLGSGAVGAEVRSEKNPQARGRVARPTTVQAQAPQVRTIVGAQVGGLPSLVQAQLREQRSAQLQAMFQAMLQAQPTAAVTAKVDPRIDTATCALLGRTWTTGGCSRQDCLAGHEYAKSGPNAETCRIGGRHGASYGVEVDFRRCDALHRTWIGLLNYCASDPHRTDTVVTDAPQCSAPYTSYVLMTEKPGAYDECMRPHRAADLQALATATGQPLALVASQRSKTQCDWEPNNAMLGGLCVAGAGGAPRVADNVAVIGDSITWRGTNELATLEPDWVIDGSSGRQIDAVDARLARYRTKYGEPGGVILALGTNGRSGWTEDEFRASLASIPASTPILFVTPFREAGSVGRPELMDDYAVWMQRLAAERPMTCLADWRAAATTDSRLLIDGVHPTSVGEVYWAEMVDGSWNSCLAKNGLTSY